MTKEQMAEQMASAAAAERAAGATVEINRSLPFIAITMSDGSEYFFQEHEADSLLSKVPDYASEEDYILWSAQGW